MSRDIEPDHQDGLKKDKKDDLEQPIKQDQQEEFCDQMCEDLQKASRGGLCLSTGLSFVFFLVIGLLLLWKQDGAECKGLGTTTMIFWIICFILAFLRFPLDTVLLFIPWKMKNIKIVYGFHKILFQVEVSLYLIYMVIATLILLISKEECEVLQSFVKWFLIISYVVLIVWTGQSYIEKKKWEEENC